MPLVKYLRRRLTATTVLDELVRCLTQNVDVGQLVATASLAHIAVIDARAW